MSLNKNITITYDNTSISSNAEKKFRKAFTTNDSTELERLSILHNFSYTTTESDTDIKICIKKLSSDSNDSDTSVDDINIIPVDPPLNIISEETSIETLTNVTFIDKSSVSFDDQKYSVNEVKSTRFGTAVSTDGDSDIVNYVDMDDIIDTSIDKNVYCNATFNIALFGCVSAGKSTFINSIIQNIYAESRVDKCTKCPQIFETNKKVEYTDDVITNIKHQIKEINQNLANNFSDDICKEVTMQIPRDNIFTDFNNIEFKFYDIPGLNDSKVSEKIYKYLENNFYKFDMIVFCVDVNSGLNTTDEHKIIKFIKNKINDMKTIYNRTVKMMVICNKSDNEVSKEEDREIQFSNIKKTLLEEGIECPVLKYSSRYTNYYRSMNTNTFKEDPKLISELGEKIYSEADWDEHKNKSIDEKIELIQKKINKKKDMYLRQSGYSELNKIMVQLIKESIFELMYSKIIYYPHQDNFKTKYNFIMILDESFDCNYGKNKISDYLDSYIEYLNKKYDTTNFTVDTVNNVNIMFKKLNELQNIQLRDTDYEKINIIICNLKKIVAEYKSKLLESIEIESGTIVTRLQEIQKSSPDSFTELIKTLNFVNNVPIEDLPLMIKYLNDFIDDKNVLYKLYRKKIISYCNKHIYSGMIHNYLGKIYNKTNDIKISELKCQIEMKPFSDFVQDDYNKLLTNVEQFIETVSL